MKSEWELKCKKCGQCCYHKIHYLSDDSYELAATHCQYLDPITNLCTCYETRQQVKPDCVEVTEEVINKYPWWPKDCGYREG